MKNPLKDFAEQHYVEGETVGVFAFTIDKKNRANYCMKGIGPKQFAIMALEWLEDAPKNLQLSHAETLYVACLIEAINAVERAFDQPVTSTFQ